MKFYQYSQFIGKKRQLVCLLGSLFFSQTLYAATYIYTDDNQFDSGTLNGVNHDAPNNNQLQLSTTGTTFPVLWIANAGEDSVSKINTNLNIEEARYKTWYGSGTHNPWQNAAPSRTAVDIDGNVYVANRHFDGRPAQVMKILSEGGIDRNGNGVIDTSSDTNGDGTIDSSEMIFLTDSNGNGKLDNNELIDERVAWAVQVGPSGGLGRSLCIDTEGDIWLGLYNSKSYYELDASDGSIKSGPISNNSTNYGCLVDTNGKLWSANLGTNLSELDTATHAVANYSHSAHGSNYGIAVGNNKVYLASRSTKSYVQFDPATSSFSTPASYFTYTFGISVDGNGDIVLGRNPIVKFAPDGSVIWSTPHPQGTIDMRGVIVDANNDVWTVNLATHTVSKFDGITGNHLATIPVGTSPYTYSDATGFAARNVTDPTGYWFVTQDGGFDATQWESITWNNEAEGNVPAGSSIQVEARAADTLAALELASYSNVTNGMQLGINGRFLGVKVTLRPNANDNSPILSDLVINGPACDLDNDGDIDKNDTGIIMSNRNQTVPPADSRLDIDGDGTITANDARVCVLQCSRNKCAL